jgi:nicotinamide phosphoribosyltransferase
MSDINPIFLIDFYKAGHVNQYPKDVRKVWVNFTPRSTRVEGETGVIFFGLQRFIKKVLIDQFNERFFWTDLGLVLRQYREVIQKTLGIANPRTDHIEQLWRYGKLPLDIYALPEGTHVPFGVPAMVIVNTEDWAFWLPNYLETTMSANIWGPCTSASTAHRYRRLFLKHAKAAGETDFSFVDWQGHDFSYRGMMGDEAAALSGMGHLLSFSGTDTLPAILEAQKYYHADLSVGGSVPATEHSVMCAGSQAGELKTFRRLLHIYPRGVLSVVSDTWNLWDVLTKVIPILKPEIEAREANGPVPAKLVIRPDSGDPVKILTGDPDALLNYSPVYKGALRLLAEALGTTNGPGGKSINKGGLIYGDSITVDRADQILTKTRQQGFSPYNHVFGIGSYTYQYVTRDTYNFAFKATAIERGLRTGRRIEAIFKEPVTAGDFSKKSARGIPTVWADGSGNLTVHETTDPSLLDNSAFRKVFNGELGIDEDFDTIRKRVRARDWVEA